MSKMVTHICTIELGNGKKIQRKCRATPKYWICVPGGERYHRGTGDSIVPRARYCYPLTALGARIVDVRELTSEELREELARAVKHAEMNVTAYASEVDRYTQALKVVTDKLDDARKRLRLAEQALKKHDARWEPKTESTPTTEPATNT